METQPARDAVTPKESSANSLHASEMELARQLHRSLLPKRLDNDLADVASCSREFDQVGGDYCTAYWQTPQNLFLCVCDVTGHSIASALLAARINTFVRLEVERAIHPCEVVDHLNAFLTGSFAGLNLFATFFCVQIDFEAGFIRYAGAGHPPALLRKTGGTIVPLTSEAPMLGLWETFPRACQGESVSFAPGDCLLLYTDGLTETRNDSGDFYDSGGLERSLAEHHPGLGAERLLEKLLGDFDAFVNGASITDDVLALCAIFKIGSKLEFKASSPN